MKNHGIVLLNFCRNPDCDCASREDLDQPRYQLSLTKAFSVHMKKASVLSYTLRECRAQ